MSETHNLPVKAKKKKRSFLDDDDFFVKKKPKVKSPARPAEPTVSASSPTTAPVLPKQEITSTKKPAHENGSRETLSSEDTSHVYHSANESFVDSDAAGSPVVPAHPQATWSPNHGLKIAQTWPSTGSSSPKNEHEPEPDILTIIGELTGDFDVKSPSISNISAGSPKQSGSPKESAQHGGNEPLDVDLIQEDIADGLDPDLKEFFSDLAKKEAETADEHSRLYSVKVSSRLGLPLEYEKQISGDTTFGELTDYLRTETLREYRDPDYWNHGVLVWVEGRSELKPFFKPSTLRIPQPENNAVTKINCLYIPHEHVANFEHLYTEFSQPVDLEDEFSIGATDEVYVLSDDDTKSGQANVAEPEDKSEYFVIGLKGKDNKRIEVEVGPTTQIRSLLKYYMQSKGITESKGQQGRVVFEDEELDLDAVVGDTELEEDFEVQVHI